MSCPPDSRAAQELRSGAGGGASLAMASGSHSLGLVHAVRSRLQPGDLVLRRSRRYTALRRLSLALSLALTVGAPLWQWHTRSALAPTTGPYGPVGAVSFFGVELIDPLATISVLAQHRLTLSLALTGLLGLLLTAFLGRFFCGWVCPYVPLLAATNALRSLLNKLGVSPPDLRLAPHTAVGVLIAVLVVGAFFGTQVWPLVYPPSLIGRELFQAVYFGGFGAGALVLLGALSFDTFISRAGFCRSLCPGGAMYRLIGAASPVTVRLDVPKCTSCTACDVICNLGQSPMTATVDEGCERCGKCVAVCPTDALSIGLRRKGARP